MKAPLQANQPNSGSQPEPRIGVGTQHPVALPADTAKEAGRHLQRANAHYMAGDLVRACDSLQCALQLTPTDVDVLMSLGCVLFQLGHADAARREFQKVVTLAPRHIGAHVKLALSELQLDHIEAFETALGRALELDPQDPDALRVLADLNLKNGLYLEAAKTYQKLLLRNPKDVDLLLLLAQSILQAGDAETPQVILDEVQRLVPGHPVAAQLQAKLSPQRSMDSREISTYPSAAEPDEASVRLIAEMNQIQWWHRIPLGNGIITPGACRHGADNEDYATNRFGLPRSLAGKTVLDIGAWDGYFSFEAERRGASLVVAADISIPEPGQKPDDRGSVGNWGANQGFVFARRVLKSNVQYLNASVYQLDGILPKLGTFAPRAFDYVFFFGVLYHLKEPLLALEKLAAITKEVALIETASTPGEGCFMTYQPGHEADPSNVWYPTATCLQAMLCRSGFRTAELVANLGSRITVRACK